MRGTNPHFYILLEVSPKSLPKFKSKIKTKSLPKTVPKWRKLLDKTKYDDNEDLVSKYTVNYAGRSWAPKMKPKNKVRSSQIRHSKRNVPGDALHRSTIDDSEDFTE